MDELIKLKKLRAAHNYTCVISDGESVYTSREKGITPLLKYIESGKDFRGFMAADLIVGKAAMLLYAHMGIKRIYADVLSQKALPVMEKYNISVQYDTLTPKIINRKGTGNCPMEEAVENIDECNMAKEVLMNKVV